MSRERFEGCLLGLALGDALGAPLEGGPLERFAWRLIGTTRRGEIRWTDDTQMSLDIAESLVATGKLDADDLAQLRGLMRWRRRHYWCHGRRRLGRRQRRFASPLGPACEA